MYTLAIFFLIFKNYFSNFKVLQKKKHKYCENETNSTSLSCNDPKFHAPKFHLLIAVLSPVSQFYLPSVGPIGSVNFVLLPNLGVGGELTLSYFIVVALTGVTTPPPNKAPHWLPISKKIRFSEGL